MSIRLPSVGWPLWAKSVVAKKILVWDKMMRHKNADDIAMQRQY
jgi:hypothetical protein